MNTIAYDAPFRQHTVKIPLTHFCSRNPARLIRLAQFKRPGNISGCITIIRLLSLHPDLIRRVYVSIVGPSQKRFGLWRLIDHPPQRGTSRRSYQIADVRYYGGRGLREYYCVNSVSIRHGSLSETRTLLGGAASSIPCI